jgi:hypothetical protein
LPTSPRTNASTSNSPRMNASTLVPYRTICVFVLFFMRTNCIFVFVHI